MSLIGISPINIALEKAGSLNTINIAQFYSKTERHPLICQAKQS